MFRVFLHVLTFCLLTFLTQIGGLAWVCALALRRRILGFLLIYIAMSSATLWIAPTFGRTAISCFETGPLQVQSPLYCALNRTYVTPELKAVLQNIAEQVAQEHPGTVTLMLDANFPFLTGFPLLPHLSHDDGEKADLAFYYADKGAYQAGKTRSFVGYFAFEEGPTDCPGTWLTLRWNLKAVQRFWRPYSLEPERMRTAITALVADERVSKIFVEPHLQTRLGLSDPKIRFQGCRAARHDDHIHLQL